ncbi:MAG: EAL domain-containing protein, partial [Gallionellaceae bacterium]|nr:EAL domain-containing protein [Gallionellaceae bacterium]
TGYSSEDLMGRVAGFNKSGYHDEVFYRNMWEMITQSGHWEGEIWNRRKNGEVFPAWLAISAVHDTQGNISRYIGVISDISEQKKAQETIYLQANYDELTLLPNRRLFFDRLEQEIKKARRSQTQVALVFVDLDNFKEINDSYGHEWGDRLLKEAAQRIQTCVREVDTVARLGGDEFTVVLPYVKSNREVDRVAQKIVDSLSAPFNLGENQGYVSASIGITVFPFDGDSSVVLLRNADQAMYEAKRLGKNRFSYYTATMQQASQQRLQLSNELRVAMQSGELEMYYQPIHDLADSRVVKAEALIRWHRPDGKHVGPDVFIGLAEEIGLIGEIGQFAIESSVRQIQAWKEISPSIVGVTINLSPRQISGDRSDFHSLIGFLEEEGTLPAHITLEITEGTLLDDNPVIRDRLARLREAGCCIALDDFGTGYSSLSYLKKMNVDFIKVDKSFIRDLAVDQNDYALVEAIIVMAHKLGIKVVAEGVETLEQNNILKKIGCDFVQGYYYARPMPSQDFINYLKAHIK